MISNKHINYLITAICDTNAIDNADIPPADPQLPNDQYKCSRQIQEAENLDISQVIENKTEELPSSLQQYLNVSE